MWWPLITNRFSLLVGNGHRVKLWSDIWCGATSICVHVLCFLFPNLFAFVELERA